MRQKEFEINNKLTNQLLKVKNNFVILNYFIKYV